MFRWLVVFVNWATGSTYFHLSNKKSELDAVEEATPHMPKSSWIWDVIAKPDAKMAKNAKKKMDNLGKVKPFDVQQNPDGTIERKE